MIGMDCVNQQARERDCKLTKRSQAERLAIANSLIASVWEEYLNGSIDRSTLQVAAYIQTDVNRIVWKLNELNNPNSPNISKALDALDCISRQKAIDAFDCTDELIVGGSANAQNVMNYINKVIGKIKALPSAQPKIEERMSETEQNVPNDDFISRKRAIDAVIKRDANCGIDSAEVLKTLPSAQPTLCGYDIDHLMLIAAVLRKENLPPERVTEALTDIGRIISIVRNEFEESLRKAVEQCKDGGVSRNDT